MAVKEKPLRGAIRNEVLAILLVLLACVPANAQDTPMGILTEIGVDQQVGAMLPLDTLFRDETGREVRLGEFFGAHPVVLVPVYYECSMLCSLVLNGFTKALRALQFTAGREFNIVTFSIDPKDDTKVGAEKRRSYLDQYGRPEAESGWHFLTGDETAIRTLTDAMGYRFKYDSYTNQWAHVSAILVATSEGRISQYLYGIELSARDLRLSLVTASENKLGTIVDSVFLYCYHYDPETGRYGFVIMSVLRLAGLATVLALGIFVVLNVRK